MTRFYVATFRESIKQANRKRKAEMIYWSLFDPTSWEIGAEFGMPETAIRKNIIDRLKDRKFGKFSKKFKKMSRSERDKYIDKFFYTGNAINNILSTNLNEIGLTTRPQSPTGGFDIRVMKRGSCVGCIGIKRFVSSLNLIDDISGHYEKIFSCDNNAETCKHLVLCFVPLFGTESPKRMHKLLTAYTPFLFNMETKKHDGETKIHFIPVDENGNSVNGDVISETENIIKKFFIALEA